MKLFPHSSPSSALFLLIITAMASAVVVSEAKEDSTNNNHVSNSNNNNSMGTQQHQQPPSTTEILAQKSKRMAERRARVAEALSNLDLHHQQQQSQTDTENHHHHQQPRKNTSSHNNLSWHRMTHDEIEQASYAAEYSASTILNLKEEEFGAQGGKLLRRVQEELKESNRKLWGNIYSDPYDPAGDLVSEATYYGE